MGRRKKKRNPQHIRSTFLNEFAQPRERRKREKETKKKYIKFEMIFGLLVCLFCLAQGAPAVEMDAATSQSLYQMTTSFLQAVMAAAVSALFVILCYAMKRKEQNLFNAKRGYSVRNYFRHNRLVRTSNNRLTSREPATVASAPAQKSPNEPIIRISFVPDMPHI